MANYNIVIDTSNFRPYDINPAITILNGYAEQRRRDQEVYDRIAQQLGELATAVGGTEKAKAIWEAYNGDLQAAMADFAQGSNQATGRALSAMRQRYFKDVVPLEKAREAMLKNLELLRNRSSQDGTLLSEKLGNLDTYLENPTYTPRMYSGALLRTQVEGMMQSIADNIVRADKLDNLDPYTQQIVKKTGLDMNTIKSAMASYMQTGKADDPAIQAIMDSVWSSAGFDSWDMDDATRNSARGWMAQGMYKLAGKKELATQQDPEGMAALNWKYERQKLALSNEYALRQMQEKANIEFNNALRIARLKQEAGGDSLPEGAGVRSWSTTTGEHIEKTKSNLQSNMKEYIASGYFDVDSRGKYVLTKKGLDAYKKGEMSQVMYKTTPGGMASGPKITYNFRQFVNNLYGVNDKLDHSKNSKVLQEGSAGVAARFVNKLKQYDLDEEAQVTNSSITSGHSMSYNATDQNLILDSLIGNADVAKFDKKTGKWVSSHKAFTADKRKEVASVEQIGYAGGPEGGILYEVVYKDASSEILRPKKSYKSVQARNASAAFNIADPISTLVTVASRGDFGETFNQILKQVNSRIIEFNRIHPQNTIPTLSKEQILQHPELLSRLATLANRMRKAGYEAMRGMHTTRGLSKGSLEEILQQVAGSSTDTEGGDLGF